MSRSHPNLDALIERVHVEAAARSDEAPPFELKDAYTIDDFMLFHGTMFVRNAYLGLLAREPDAAGLAKWVAELYAGSSRADVLGRIRYSAEGRRAGRPVKGLAVAFARQLAERIPILSHFVALAGLPRLCRHHRRLEALTTAQSRALWDAQQADTALARRALDTGLLERDAQIAQIRSQFVAALEDLEQRLGDASADALIAVREEFGAETTAQGTALRDAQQAGIVLVRQALDAQIAHIRSEFVAVDDRVKSTARDLHVFKLGSDAVDPVPAARFDALYTAFEDAFRGPPDVVRRRLALYLPAVREAQAGAPTRPVLDLGSGRGEWLTLLREEGLEARGVEINALTAHASRDAGLDVATADLFAHLKTTADASLGAVTSFHVIEHIAFEALVQLLAQAHRTLKPGGLLLLETPNPENTVVGSCNFYADPTHRRPIPPETLAFLVRNAGFGAVTIRRLWEDRIADPWANEAAVKPATVQRAIDIVRTNFFAPPDYAVLATRP